ncbi:MAG: hypothetical protein EBZ52_00505 [Actinobacteria bacterium]|nr:hypothetical protein [Actinomycetota bacterium]
MKEMCPVDWTVGGFALQDTGECESHTSSAGHLLITNSGMLLRSQLLANEKKFDLVVIDLAPPPHATANNGDWRAWLHALRGLIGLGEQVVSESGRILVELPDTALLYVCAQTDLSVLWVAVWKKKYGPQNDANRLIEPMHDFLVLLGRNPDRVETKFAYVPWEVAGKSEDGTREFQEAAAKVGVQVRTPSSIKPTSLWRWYAEHFSSGTDSILELNHSGWGLGDVLLDRCDVTKVVWSNTDDYNSIRSYLNATLTLNDEPTKTLSGTVATNIGHCDCRVVLEDRAKSPQTRDPESFLKLDQPLDDASAVSVAVGEDLETFTERYLKEASEILLLKSPVTDALLRAAAQTLKRHGVMVVPASECFRTNETSRALLARFALLGSLSFTQSQSKEGGAELLAIFGRKDSSTSEINSLRPAVQSEYSTDESDPRGPWRDPGSKGARSGSRATAFELHVPPYQWKVEQGELPTGLWRLSPETGVIWGHPKVLGEWRCVVTVTDGKMSKTREVRFIVEDDFKIDSTSEMNAVRDWLVDGRTGDTEFQFENQVHRLKRGVNQFVQLRAKGGARKSEVIGPPGKSLGKNKRTRYWEFSLGTFLEAVCEDRVVWGRDRNGNLNNTRPRIKKFQRDEPIRTAAIRSIQQDETLTSDAIKFHLQTLFSGRTVIEIEAKKINIFHHAANGDPRLITTARCNSCEMDESGIACSPSHGLERLGYLLGGKTGDVALSNSKVAYQHVVNLVGDSCGIFVNGVLLTEKLFFEVQAQLSDAVGKAFGTRLLKSSGDQAELRKVNCR